MILDALEDEDIILYTTASEAKFVDDSESVLTISCDDEIFVAALKSEDRLAKLKDKAKELCGYTGVEVIKSGEIGKKSKEETDILELAYNIFGKDNVDIIDD